MLTSHIYYQLYIYLTININTSKTNYGNFSGSIFPNKHLDKAPTMLKASINFICTEMDVSPQ